MYVHTKNDLSRSTVLKAEHCSLQTDTQTRDQMHCSCNTNEDLRKLGFTLVMITFMCTLYSSP